jgi:hypothetical protein
MGIPQKVPLDGSVTYKELAGPAQITPELLQRLVRLAALGGFLLEDATGKVRHTAMSAVFHLDRDVADMTHFMTQAARQHRKVQQRWHCMLETIITRREEQSGKCLRMTRYRVLGFIRA